MADNTPSYLKIREMERILQRNYRAPWETIPAKTNFELHWDQVKLGVDQMYLALRQYKAERTETNLRNIVRAKKILETLGYHVAVLGVRIDGTLAVRRDVWESLFAPTLKPQLVEQKTEVSGG